MKTADLQPGVLYAQRYTAHSSPKPLLLLSTTLHATRFQASGLTIAASYEKAGRGHGYTSRDVGLPAIARFSVDQVDTPEKLAALYQAGRDHLAAMLSGDNPPHSSFQPAGFPDNGILTLPQIGVFTPQQFMGQWEFVKAQYDADEAQKSAQRDARRNADFAAQVDYGELVEKARAVGITSLDRTYGPSDRTKVQIDRADLRKLLDRFALQDDPW